MTHFGETEDWLHFKNAVGMQFSVRRFCEEYPDFTPHLNVEGDDIVLPKNLVTTIELAEVFANESSDDNKIIVAIKSGKIQVRSTGTNGAYLETKKTNYSGSKRSFKIAPKLLADITERFNDCILGDDKLKVDGGSFQYISALDVVSKDE